MISRFQLLIILFLLITAFASGAIVYPSLPETVPTHWNISGKADGFGARWVDTFLLPAIAVTGFLAMLLYTRFASASPRLAGNLPVLWGVCILITAMLVAIHLVILLVVAGRHIPIERAFPLIVGIAIAVIGNSFGKLRQNRFVGIRTPWTLGNELVWERTHRAAGPVMVLYGLAIILASLFATPVVMYAAIIGGAALLLTWSIIYSKRIFDRLGSGRP